MNDRTERYFPEIIDERSSYHNLSPLTAIIHDLRRKNVVTAAAASGPQMSLLDSSDPWGSSESSFGVDDNLQLPQSPYGSTCACATGTKLSFTPQSRRMSWSGGVKSRYGTRRASLGYASSPTKQSSQSSGTEQPPQLNLGDNQYDQYDGSSHPNAPPPPGGGERDTSTSPSGTCPNCGKMKSNNESLFSVTMPRRHQPSFWLDRTRTERLEEPQHAESLLQSTPQLRILSPASTDMQGAGTTGSRNFFDFMLAPMKGHHHHDHSNHHDHHHHHGSDHNGINGSSSGSSGSPSDYRASLVRDRANQQAATELSSLLWILAHEMSLEDYGAVESEVFTSVFALVHAPENERRMAGLAAVDALIDAPSADEEKKAIKFANTLSNGLRSAHGDYEFLSAVSKALGHMATRTANVDFVESEVTRALEWLRTERSDRRYENAKRNTLPLDWEKQALGF
jgi:hypothetical protein